jgi:hypothetical protein
MGGQFPNRPINYLSRIIEIDNSQWSW